MRKTPACLAAAGLALSAAAPATAQIFPDKDARTVSNTFFRAKDLAKSAFDASWIVRPGAGFPTGRSDSKIANFPRRGTHFAILSTGDVRKVDNKNNSKRTSSNNYGPVLRGTRDLVMMRTRFRVPKGKNCMRLPFKFLSEEFPEYVDSSFNDAFIAELGRSTWSSDRNDPDLDIAPKSFAQDTKGNPITINAVGDAKVRRKYAKGTTFDAATRTLRASTPVKPGAKQTLYLSIFDQGDRQYDSAVFLDRLRFVKSSNCDKTVSVDK